MRRFGQCHRCGAFILLTGLTPATSIPVNLRPPSHRTLHTRTCPGTIREPKPLPTVKATR